ncbi:MAG: type II secretion system protein M [Haliea sp.]|jgi:general secretion pathway protein M|nr:type II secretion system protein M [Haliea sp.]
MAAWWSRLTVREQTSLLLLSITVGAWLLWMVVWSPLAAKRDRMVEQNVATAAALVRVDALSAQVLQAREGAAPARTGSNLAAVVNQSTVRFGLAVSRLQPGARGDLQVRLENAQFADLVAWLHQLELREGLVFEEVAITQAGSAGRVNATVRIGQPP